MYKVFIILLVLCWAAGAFFFFVGPAKAANRYVDELSSSITKRDDAVLFRQLYKNKLPRNVLVAWLLTAFLTPSISYVYSRQWVRCVLATVTFEGLGLWWLVSIFSMPYEVMKINKHLADEAYAELRLARPEFFRHAGEVKPDLPGGLNPETAARVEARQAGAGADTASLASRTGTSPQRVAAKSGAAAAPSGFCAGCGNPRASSARFCATCGASQT